MKRQATGKDAKTANPKRGAKGAGGWNKNASHQVTLKTIKQTLGNQVGHVQSELEKLSQRMEVGEGRRRRVAKNVLVF